MTKKNTILIFGECMLELIGIHNGSIKHNFAGDTFNTAVYLKRLKPDCSVKYMSAIGADNFSQELVKTLHNERIDTEYLMQDTERNLGIYSVNIDAKGERTFDYWRQNSAATQTFNLLNKPVISPCYFYFSGISLAILDTKQRNQLIELIVQFKANGTSIVFDPNYRPKLWKCSDDAASWFKKVYQLCDIIFPGVEDHSVLFNQQSVDEVITFMRQFYTSEIIIKNGPKSIHIVNPNAHLVVPVDRIEKVVDTTAAGDSFVAGYLAARLCRLSSIDCAKKAIKLAGIVISQRGAIIDKSLMSKF